MKERGIFVVFIYRYYVNYEDCGTVVAAFENTYQVAGYSEV